MVSYLAALWWVAGEAAQFCHIQTSEATTNLAGGGALWAALLVEHFWWSSSVLQGAADWNCRLLMTPAIGKLKGWLAPGGKGTFVPLPLDKPQKLQLFFSDLRGGIG